MNESRRKFAVSTLAMLGLSSHAALWANGFRGGVRDAYGERFRDAPNAPRTPLRRPPRGNDTLNRLRHWNQIAIDCSGLDHTPPRVGENRVFGEQLGPARASRALAIAHIAMFDAVNGIVGTHRSYTGVSAGTRQSSMDAAIAQAAHDTLVALFPSQRTNLDQLLGEDLSLITAASQRAKSNGIDLGARASAAIIARRAADRSQHAEPRVGVDFIPSNAPGKWRQDPVSRVPLALGARWGAVKPFVLRSAAAFRVPPPPRLNSAQYAAAFDEVRRVGGDGAVTPTVRSETQKNIGIFWAYDGTPSLCAPPRLYNQIAVQIAEQKGSDAVQLARLLALANVAMADAAIAIWESKYFYQVWRPVAGVREADRDGNAATLADPTFMPLGAPASNLTGPNFTPPFPAYPSGHAGFGAALFRVLRRFYGSDRVAFTFVSDELNGVTLDANGSVRPRLPRSFATLSQAEEENGQSRVYLGIHWAFDKTAGIAQGRRVADAVFDAAFGPRR